MFRQEAGPERLRKHFQQQLQRHNKGNNNGYNNNGAKIQGKNSNVLVNGATPGHSINLHCLVSNGLVERTALNDNIQLDRPANGSIINPNAVMGAMSSMETLEVLETPPGNVSSTNGATINAFNQHVIFARLQQYQHQNPGLQQANQNILNEAGVVRGVPFLRASLLLHRLRTTPLPFLVLSIIKPRL